MSSPGMGTGSFGLRKELSSFMAIRSTMDTTLTTSVGRWVFGSWEQTSIRVWNWRKGNNLFPPLHIWGLCDFKPFHSYPFNSIQLHMLLAIQAQVSPGFARNREPNNLNKQKLQGKASGSCGGDCPVNGRSGKGGGEERAREKNRKRNKQMSYYYQAIVQFKLVWPPWK